MTRVHRPLSSIALVLFSLLLGTSSAGVLFSAFVVCPVSHSVFCCMCLALLGPSLIASTLGPTSFHVFISSDTDATIQCGVFTIAALTPTAADITAGTGTVVPKLSQIATANLAVTFAFGGLQGLTSYKVFCTDNTVVSTPLVLTSVGQFLPLLCVCLLLVIHVFEQQHSHSHMIIQATPSTLQLYLLLSQLTAGSSTSYSTTVTNYFPALCSR